MNSKQNSRLLITKLRAQIVYPDILPLRYFTHIAIFRGVVSPPTSATLRLVGLVRDGWQLGCCTLSIDRELSITD